MFEEEKNSIKVDNGNDKITDPSPSIATTKIGEKRSLKSTADKSSDIETPTEKKQFLGHAVVKSSENTKDGTTENETKIEDKKEAEMKPKFVFGGSSSFSKGFKFTKPLVPDFNNDSERISSKKDDISPLYNNSDKQSTDTLESKKKTESKEVEEDFGSKKSIKAFGSATTFGQGFGLLKEIANKNAVEPEVSKDENKSDEKVAAKEDNPVQSTAPALSKLEEVYNGEENEDILFNSNSKLYALIDLKEGWKERGLGPIHLNYNKESKTHRLVIRQRLTFQILLNLRIVKGMKVFKGFPGSSNPEKFVRIAVTMDKQVVQYTMKFGSEDMAEDIYKLLQDLV
ncbi:hypothetical protein QEN19_003123 [Hanseniaspora menglaensis]